MGFCDPSPAATKLLLVYYTFKVSQGGRAQHGRPAGPPCCLGCRLRESVPPLPRLVALQGRPYRATISDTEGAALPARGALVQDEAEAEFVLQLATQLGEEAAGGGSDGKLANGGSTASLCMAPSSGWLDNPSFLQRGTSTLD
jgi:hypothetical protein